MTQTKESRTAYLHNYYLANKAKYAERQKRYRRENPIKVAETERRWKAAHPEIVAESYRRYKQANKLKTYTIARRNMLKNAYGLTIEGYKELLNKQSGACAICLCPETRKLRGRVWSLSIDHNHTTGKVRGLLCAACNTALGMLREDPLRVHAMLRYIAEHRD